MVRYTRSPLRSALGRDAAFKSNASRSSVSFVLQSFDSRILPPPFPTPPLFGRVAVQTLIANSTTPRSRLKAVSWAPQTTARPRAAPPPASTTRASINAAERDAPTSPSRACLGTRTAPAYAASARSVKEIAASPTLRRPLRTAPLRPLAPPPLALSVSDS